MSVLDQAPGASGLVAVLARTPLSLRIGAAILLVHLIVAITGPFWAPYGYSQMGTGLPLAPASLAHPFGVDQLGRDVFSRVVHELPVVDGRIALPQGPGLGITVDDEMLRRFQVA